MIIQLDIDHPFFSVHFRVYTVTMGWVQRFFTTLDCYDTAKERASLCVFITLPMIYWALFSKVIYKHRVAKVQKKKKTTLWHSG